MAKKKLDKINVPNLDKRVYEGRIKAPITGKSLHVIRALCAHAQTTLPLQSGSYGPLASEATFLAQRIEIALEALYAFEVKQIDKEPTPPMDGIVYWRNLFAASPYAPKEPKQHRSFADVLGDTPVYNSLQASEDKSSWPWDDQKKDDVQS